MKVKFKKNTECWTDLIKGTIEVDVEIPTADLIAERLDWHTEAAQ